MSFWSPAQHAASAGATAEAFARLGGTLAVHYHHSRTQAEQLVRTLPHAKHCSFSADLTDPAACERLINDAVARFGRLDVLVNNAGIYEVRPLAELDYTGLATDLEQHASPPTWWRPRTYASSPRR